MRDLPGSTTPPVQASGAPRGLGHGAGFLDRAIGRSLDVRSMSVILLFGVPVLLLGLDVVRASAQWGFTWDGAINGISSQLGTTLPAGILVAVALALNVTAGAILLRLMGVDPFRTLSDLILGGFAAAVVLDAAMLFLLGGLGWFGWPELLLIHAATLAAYLAMAARLPLLAAPLRFRPRRPAAWWIVIAIVWAGPLIVQLASPAVPFLDVLPNHVAPVEHVRVFGSFATLTTSPSPIYGPSRLMLGYVGLLSDITTLTGLHAVLAEAAFGMPLAILCAVGMRRLAISLFGGSAGFWVLLAFPLTFAFVRIPDARGTVVVFPLVALALSIVAGNLRHSGPGTPATLGAGKVPGGATSGAGRAASEIARRAPLPRPDLVLAFAFGAAVLVHPLIGLFTLTAAIGAVILEPGRLARKVLPAIGSGAVLAIPQVETMLGIGSPAWIGFIFVTAAIVAAFFLASVADALADRASASTRLAAARRAVPAGTAVGLVIAAIVFLTLLGHLNLAAGDDPMQEIPHDFPRLLILCLAGTLLCDRRRETGWFVLGCGVAAGLLAMAASGFVGSANLTQLAVHYEVPKAFQYWLPVLLSIGAAGGISAFRRAHISVSLRAAVDRRLKPTSDGSASAASSVWPFAGMLRYAAIGAGLILAIYPTSTPLTTNVQIGEHRAAESVGLALREAQNGYWTFYPDPRLIIDASRQAVVDELRSEESAGRLGPSTRVLNIASSFQQWVSVPVGVFTGAIETSISTSPEVSIHTEGGRLLGFQALQTELASGYGYVLLEPNGLTNDQRNSATSALTAAGYHQIWSNSQATIYVPETAAG